MLNKNPKVGGTECSRHLNGIPRIFTHVVAKCFILEPETGYKISIPAHREVSHLMHLFITHLTTEALF